MKTTFKTAAALAGSLGLFAGAASAQTSPVVGFYSEDLVPGFNVMGVSLHPNPVISGTFEGDLTDNDVDFTTVLTDLAGTTYLLEVEDGGGEEGAVAIITGSSTTTNPNDTLTLEGGATLATGTANYTIRPAATLDDLFLADLTGSFNANAADIIWLPDGSGGYDQYFYSSTGSEFRPNGAPFVPVAKPIPVFYPDGMFVQIQNSAATVVISGDLKDGGTIVAANNGFSLVASPGPVGVTLAVAAMETFLDGSFNANAADVVWIPTGGGAYDQYFYNSTASVWRETGSPFAGDESARELTSGFFIERKGTSTSGLAAVPTYYNGL